MQLLRYRLLGFGEVRPSKWVCIHPQMCEWVREPKMQLQPSRLSGTANRSQRPANHRRPRLLEAREGRYAATLGSKQWLRCWVCDGEVSVVGACIGECRTRRKWDQIPGKVETMFVRSKVGIPLGQPLLPSLVPYATACTTTNWIPTAVIASNSVSQRPSDQSAVALLREMNVPFRRGFAALRGLMKG